MKQKINDETRSKEKIKVIYVPLKELIFEDNERRIDVVGDFTEYSHVLAGIELIMYTFIAAHPETDDQDLLRALKRIRKDPLYQFSHSEEDALAFAITYGMSRGLQQKRLAINEIYALLDWLIQEIEGRMQRDESYIGWLKTFFKDNPINVFRGDKK